VGIAYVRWRNLLDNVRIPQGASVANNAARVTTEFLVRLCRNALSVSDYPRSGGRRFVDLNNGGSLAGTRSVTAQRDQNRS
jgi:hypothetical protein